MKAVKCARHSEHWPLTVDSAGIFVTPVTDTTQLRQMTTLGKTSKYFKQDLIAIVMNNESLGLSQQIIVLLEATIHLWKAHEFQG